MDGHVCECDCVMTRQNVFVLYVLREREDVSESFCKCHTFMATIITSSFNLRNILFVSPRLPPYPHRVFVTNP